MFTDEQINFSNNSHVRLVSSSRSKRSQWKNWEFTTFDNNLFHIYKLINKME